MKNTSVSLAFLLCINLAYTQTSFTDLVTKTEKSVATVNTYDAEGAPLKIGTAFFIDDSGILLSNFHVFEGANTAKISTSENKQYQVEKILSSSKEYDLIKFSISNSSNEHFPRLEMADTPPSKGEDIFVIGTPEGFGSSVSKGIVSGIRVIEGLGNIFQITAPISAGSSGSPVLNMQGKVFAIASYQYQNGQNLNFAIDLKLVDKLKSNEAFNSSIDINKDLPDDKSETIIIIDTLIKKYDTLSLYYVNKFIDRYPNSYNGYLYRAYIYSFSYYFGIRSSKENLFYNKAEADFKKAISLAPSSAQIYGQRAFAKSIALMNKHLINIEGWNLKGALEDIKKCQTLDKNYDIVKTISTKASILLDMGDNFSALDEYNKLISLTPQDDNAYFWRAAVKYNLNDTLGAINDLTKAISIKAICNYYDTREHYLMSKKNYSEALKDINFLFKNCNNSQWDYESYYHKSLILTDIDGDINEALNSINLAIKIFNESTEYLGRTDWTSSFHLQRALIYFKLEYYTNALADMNVIFNHTSTNDLSAYLYSFRSTVKINLNDKVGALKDINKAIELCSTDDYYYYNKAVILTSMDDNSGALTSINKAIKINPKDTQYFIKRGFIEYDTNKQSACADWSKAGEMGDYSAYDLIKEYCK